MIDGSRIPATTIFGRLLRAPFRLLPRDREVRILSGTLKGARWILGSSSLGCWTGGYERDAQLLAEQWIRTGDVVFDLGANVGFFTLHFSRLVGPEGRVIGFEPLAKNLKLLNHHLSINGVRNVDVLPYAVSESTGEMHFMDSEDSRQARLSPGGDVSVMGTTLDLEVSSGRVRAPGFLKMDVEGAEVSVLRGSRRVLLGWGPTVWIETHGWRAHEECSGLLESSCYKIVDSVETGESGQGRLVAVPGEFHPKCSGALGASAEGAR